MVCIHGHSGCRVLLRHPELLRQICAFYVWFPAVPLYDVPLPEAFEVGRHDGHTVLMAAHPDGQHDIRAV